MTDPSLSPATHLLHAGGTLDDATGAVGVPLHFATTFARDADNALPSAFLYGRYGNPTRATLEQALAELEGGSAAAAFASGLAAASCVLQALGPGDRVILGDGVYSGVRSLVTTVFGPWGLRATFVDERDPASWERALAEGPAALVWIESPSNPQWLVTDIARVAAAARACGARVLVDNTVATPLGQSPLALGADLVLHSTTKYLGGHSDVTGGALVHRERDGAFERTLELQKLVGGVPSPFDCWLILRGMRTLDVRVERQSRSAQRIAEALVSHPRVSAVHYPGLSSHPAHEVARRQMRLFSGMLSFEHAGGREGALRALRALRLFARATSLGGVESLAEHRKTVEAPETPTPESLIRLSVGLEAVEDLLADVIGALDAS